MSTAALNTSIPVSIGSDGQITNIAEIDNALTGLIGGNFTEGHMHDSLATVYTISSAAPSSPKTGAKWLDTSTAGYISKYWSGTAWIEQWAVSATKPVHTIAGFPWYDTTLGLLRIYGTRYGNSDWHPVGTSHQIWKNVSGSNLLAGRVAAVGTTGSPRDFSVAGLDKTPGVVGVLAEDIDNSASGVITMIAAGAEVDLYVLGSTHGAVAKGDGLVTSGTPAGAARTVGTIDLHPYSLAARRRRGLPLGCFAKAMESTSLDEKIRCQLLGAVGEGATVMLPRTTITSNPTFESAEAWRETDLTADLLDPDHGPILSAIVEADVVYGPSTELYVEFSVDSGTPSVDRRIHLNKAGANALAIGVEVEVFTVNNSVTGVTALGNKFSHRMNRISGSNSSGTMAILGYLY